MYKKSEINAIFDLLCKELPCWFPAKQNARMAPGSHQYNNHWMVIMMKFCSTSSLVVSSTCYSRGTPNQQSHTTSASSL